MESSIINEMLVQGDVPKPTSQFGTWFSQAEKGNYQDP
jgi:hypothetical protein